VTVVRDCVQRETDKRYAQSWSSVNRVYDTARRNITPKTTEQNRIVRTGKSEPQVTSNKKAALDVLYY